MTDLRALQVQYEEDSDNRAAADRLEYLKKQSREGDVDLPRAQKFIARAYSQVRESLEAEIAVKTRGTGGKFKGWLRKLDLDVAAVIALRTCIEAVTVKYRGNLITVQQIAMRIGSMYETEVKIKEAEAVNPLYMKRVHDQVSENGTSSKDHLRKLYNAAYSRVMKGELDSSLSSSDLLNLGKFGLQAVMDAGILEVSLVKGYTGTVSSYKLTPDVEEFLYGYDGLDVQRVLNASTGAMLCEPDPWTHSHDGGYLTVRRKQETPLVGVHKMRRDQRRRLRNDVYTAEKMPKVFEAGNYLQNMQYSVHLPTMLAIERVWNAGGGVLGVPTKNAPRKPPSPVAPEWTKADGTPEELEVFSKWKRSVVAYHRDMKAWRGRTREIGGFLRIGSSLTQDIWFPVFLDSRGRWYYRGMPNPQGSDISKAVLHYSVKKPLGKDGLYWLKVHIANTFGFDKVRFDERAAWVDANWESIRRALDEPENHADVWGDDSPWSMFSAAYELNQAFLSGNPETYATGVIVHMDATCSGLQHFSAMLRDPVGGEYVNLTDDGMGGPKQDIYARVAENCMLAMHRDAQSPDAELALISGWWIKQGIPRALAKKPVMTYVYGATLRGTAEFVDDYIDDEVKEPLPDGVRRYDVTLYAAKKLFEGIALTVPAAEAAMQWLRGVARQMPKGQRMEWTAPTGFRVQHDYQAYDETRVRLRSCGLEYVVVKEFNDGTMPISMQNAISPNFVHALDASHLTFTALRMKELGLHMTGIHDSFGTHPSDVTSMHTAIREAFLELYKGRNVLAEFLWEVGGIGDIPMRGTLDIDKVLDSEFFFC